MSIEDEQEAQNIPLISNSVVQKLLQSWNPSHHITQQLYTSVESNLSLVQWHVLSLRHAYATLSPFCPAVGV